MDESDGGISRRRVIIGTAWLTPAIVLAVAVPRAAASTLTGGGLQYIGFTATFQQVFDEDPETSADLPAIVAQADIQNIPDDPGGSVPDVIGATLTFFVPVGSLPGLPRWGLGGDGEGVQNEHYELDSTPSVSDTGVFSISFIWSGTGGTWSNAQPTLWVEVSGPEVQGQPVSSTVTGVHANNDTSFDSSDPTFVT